MLESRGLPRDVINGQDVHVGAMQKREKDKLGRDQAGTARKHIHRSVVKMKGMVGALNVLDDEIDDFESGRNDGGPHGRDALAALDALQERAARKAETQLHSLRCFTSDLGLTRKQSSRK